MVKEGTVENGRWYGAFWVEQDDTVKYTKGTSVTLQLPKGDVKCRTLDIIDDQGQWLILLESDRYYEDLPKLRKENVTVVTSDYEGLLLANESIATEDGQPGVFVKDLGGDFVFRPVIDLIDTMSPSNAAVNRIVSQPVDAVVLFDDGTDAVFELAERLYIGKSVSAVVMVCPDMTASVLQRVVDCGASKAVDYKTAQEDLAEAVIKAVRREKSRALAPSETGSYQSRVISVFGTKGGSGKTDRKSVV